MLPVLGELTDILVPSTPSPSPRNCGPRRRTATRRRSPRDRLRSNYTVNREIDERARQIRLLRVYYRRWRVWDSDLKAEKRPKVRDVPRRKRASGHEKRRSISVRDELSAV
jgi:hypothetical protein